MPSITQQQPELQSNLEAAMPRVGNALTRLTRIIPKQDKIVRRRDIDFDYSNLDIDYINHQLLNGTVKECMGFNNGELKAAIANHKKIMLAIAEKMDILGFTKHRMAKRIMY